MAGALRMHYTSYSFNSAGNFFTNIRGRKDFGDQLRRTGPAGPSSWAGRASGASWAVRPWRPRARPGRLGRPGVARKGELFVVGILTLSTK